VTAPTDPILAKRARIAKLVQTGKRLGYSVLLAAVVAFVVGYFAGFTSWLVTAIVVALVVSSIVLAPAIVFGYGVRAAEREEREERAAREARGPKAR
jgi:hypothetical protein